MVPLQYVLDTKHVTAPVPIFLGLLKEVVEAVGIEERVLDYYYSVGVGAFSFPHITQFVAFADGYVELPARSVIERVVDYAIIASGDEYFVLYKRKVCDHK